MISPTLALIGNFKTLQPLAVSLAEAGIPLLIQAECPSSKHADLALQLIETDSVALECDITWMAWDVSRNPQATSRAYQMGARAVFPAATPIETIVQALRRALDELVKTDAPAPHARQRKYQRGELILLEADAVLHVEQGVLATTMIHHDGAEVLLGLSGKGQILVAHPDDNCHIEIVAHTDTSVHIEPWNSAVQHPDFTAKLRARLQQMEGWAAMQARPLLQQRILGLLGLLAEQFGKPCETGIVIEVRITHNQLAAAVGATRTSITRVLSELRAQDRISTVTRDGDDLLCLTEISDRHYHY